MSKKQYVLLLAAAVVAGLVSGVVSSWFLMGSPVFAKPPEQVDDIRAERFVVVDKGETPAPYLVWSLMCRPCGFATRPGRHAPRLPCRLMERQGRGRM